MTIFRVCSFVVIALALAGCNGVESEEIISQPSVEDIIAEQGVFSMPNNAPLVAHLADSDDTNFKEIQAAFRDNNPGYDIDWQSAVTEIEATETERVVFVQRQATVATIFPMGYDSEIDVGDILLLRPGQSVSVEEPTDFLIFTVPEPFSDTLPDVIRPDWDPKITDVVGGCAEETGAYRRLLLTWQEAKGAYIYHSLNAHRVRIMDSFTHYHPLDGGFDEFYLVQMAQPNARIITSTSVDLIENPDSVTADQAAGLLAETPLQVGDLVYLPRGMAHRGVDSVLAQVISTPGFMPNAEIGLDHYLRAISERLKLEEPLPYNEAASEKAVVK